MCYVHVYAGVWHTQYMTLCSTPTALVSDDVHAFIAAMLSLWLTETSMYRTVLFNSTQITRYMQGQGIGM